MRDSMRMRRNLESLSRRLRSRCLRTATAFLISMYRSSGISAARPVLKGFVSDVSVFAGEDAVGRRGVDCEEIVVRMGRSEVLHHTAGAAFRVRRVREE